LTGQGMSDKVTYMKAATVRTGSREFLRGYRRFKEIAARGGQVQISDRDGGEFVFMRVGGKQHPPRQAERPLDPNLFAGIDLDEPAIPSEEWEANG
jgi:hypothetical protein